MTYKKAPVHLTWDANDYKRVTAYFALLVQIDKRVSKANSSSHTVKEEPKEIEQSKLKADIWTRDPTGLFILWEYTLDFIISKQVTKFNALRFGLY